MAATRYCALLLDANGDEFEADVVLAREYDDVLFAALAANEIAAERNKAEAELDKARRTADYWKAEHLQGMPRLQRCSRD